ncbi:hypothetical protein FRB96_004742 [Tulasnella sp. 330]|nr:hypothetical protein FRB96_004742 [Tulasnella sp. 330]KAG8876780.1 hypothetical protein FRB97_003931 [Tulasnella sp. 331]
MSVNPAAFRRLMREIKQLKTEPQEGIRIITDEENMLDVTGIIQGPDGTPYEGGYFKIKFHFTEEFPAAPPKCSMVTKIFHPNVSKSGEICVNTLKKDWKREYGIAHILVTVKCLLIYPNAESALDEAAGKLLLEKYEDYCKHARLMTQVHATPKTRPVEFDIPSVIPANKTTAVPIIGPSTSTTAPTRQTTPTPVGMTRLQTHTYNTRQNSPGPTPLTPSTQNSMPLPQTATSTKPISKSSIAMEPLQTSSNGRNDQNVDPSLAAPAGAGKMDLSSDNPKTVAAPLKTPPSASAPLKRSAGTTSGGVEKRKKGLKRL